MECTRERSSLLQTRPATVRRGDSGRSAGRVGAGGRETHAQQDSSSTSPPETPSHQITFVLFVPPAPRSHLHRTAFVAVQASAGSRFKHSVAIENPFPLQAPHVRNRHLAPSPFKEYNLCKRYGRSSRPSRQREGRARWKPFTAPAGALMWPNSPVSLRYVEGDRVGESSSRRRVSPLQRPK